MLDVSTKFHNRLLEGDVSYQASATIYAHDISGNEVELEVENSDIWNGGFNYQNDTTGGKGFDIGGAIASRLVITLYNGNNKFSTYDFSNATVWAYVSLELLDGTIEHIRIGKFFVDEANYNGSTITLNCLDGLGYLDTPYSEVSSPYPRTLSQIVGDILSHCGLTNDTGAFPKSTLNIEERPKDDKLTCRDMISYVAQICGCFVRCNQRGGVEFRWYDKSFLNRTNISGGVFDSSTPYSSGANINGGVFDDGQPIYTTGDNYDVGGFDNWGSEHNIFAYTQYNVSTDDVEITGVKITIDKENSYQFGDTKYTLEISGNPLIDKSNYQEIGNHLYNRISGIKIRPVSGITFIGNPSMESGDSVVINDTKGNVYNAFMTSFSFGVGKYSTMKCSLETPTQKRSKTYGIAAKTAMLLEETVKEQISDYAMDVENMNSLALNSMGFYQTVEKQDDGSTIVYSHNKPTLADSSTVYKKTADGFFLSRDGGNTYVNGFDASGNAVLNILSAIGIKFDWAKGGTLSLGGSSNTNGKLTLINESGNQVGYWDATMNPCFCLAINPSTGKSNFSVYKDGTVKIEGDITANSGTFKGALSGATGDFTGEITANSGHIGGTNGFTIGSNKIYSNEKSSLNGSSANKEGVYIGNDGIALGKTVNNVSKFEVDNKGTIVIHDGFIRGDGLAIAAGTGIGAEYKTGGHKYALFQLEGNNLNLLIDANDGVIKLGSQITNGVWIYGEDNYPSDRKLKDNIEYIPSEKSYAFINNLKPVSYVMKKNPKSKHHGFIAQEVESIENIDWNIVSSVDEDGEKTLGIAYREIIADLVGSVQYLSKKIEDLEEKLRGDN